MARGVKNLVSHFGISFHHFNHSCCCLDLPTIARSIFLSARKTATQRRLGKLDFATCTIALVGCGRPRPSASGDRRSFDRSGVSLGISSDSIRMTLENDLHLGRMSTALALPFAVFISLQRGIASRGAPTTGFHCCPNCPFTEGRCSAPIKSTVKNVVWPSLFQQSFWIEFVIYNTFIMTSCV